MIGVQLVFGFVLANLVEWFVHKYILHGLGQNKKSIWSFHWHQHHRTCRKNGNLDLDYQKRFWEDGYWQSSGKEVKGLFLLAITQLPWLWFYPWVFVATLIHICLYYYVHRKSHIDVKWGKKYLRHHYEHHMFGNQQTNWNVTYPLGDFIFGTRTKFNKQK